MLLLALTLLLFLLADAAAETRTVALKKENPLLGRTTLVLANVGLVLVALAQVAFQIRKRRHKYKLAATTPAPPVARAPAPGPAPAPAVGTTAARIVRCGTCGISLKVSAPRFKCPKCATVGVAA